MLKIKWLLADEQHNVKQKLATKSPGSEPMRLQNTHLHKACVTLSPVQSMIVSCSFECFTNKLIDARHIKPPSGDTECQICKR